jgi:hypothetical protein
MPGLNPLMNVTKPRHQIPNEAPQYFSPFFEQPQKPPPISIWQPPNVELPPRSKAPINRPRTPPTIPTAGTWTKKKTEEEEKETGLFQLKKKSVDEIMWLGSVAGFSVPESSQGSLRSKLVRKPEEIPSQASAATDRKVMEARRRKQEEAQAREKRLEEWATKKKNDKQSKPSGPILIPSPQPIESRFRTRKKIYTPLPQSDEVARLSNRPNAIHRPHLPHSDSSGYAPERTFLPQPIETVRRSNRAQETPKKSKPDSEETMWMGSPQPQLVETVKRSNRRTRLNQMARVSEGGSGKEKSTQVFPEPVETTKRSNRAQKWQATSDLPSPVEATRHPNRSRRDNVPLPIDVSDWPLADSEQLPQYVESAMHSNRQELLPQPVEAVKRSSRSSAKTSEKSNGSDKQDNLSEPVDLPEPVETTKRSSRPAPTPVQRADPPTPTTSFFGPDIIPPAETRRPINARPLITSTIEDSVRSTRMRIPVSEIHMALPQPVSVMRWNNHSAGVRPQRRESTTQKPLSPSPLPSPKDDRKKRPAAGCDYTPAADHVWHLHEPIDSAPSSPAGSPAVSPEPSPSNSKCPSLSSSPSSSASAAWEGSLKSEVHGGAGGHNDSHGIGRYVIALEHDLKQQGAVDEGVLHEKAREGQEYPFPCLAEAGNRRTAAAGLGIRSESSETIRPRPTLRAIETEPAIKINEEPNDADDYPICHSPAFTNLRHPEPPITLAPDQDLEKHGKAETDSRIQSNAVEMSKPLSLAASLVPYVQLPTPPNSHMGSMSNQTKNVMSGPTTASPRMWQARAAGPSPGYTVASLPPRKKDTTIKEVTPDFIEDVFRYLSLQFENIAHKFDGELAEYTRSTISEVRKDRRAALTQYCDRFVRENPEFAAGEASKAGLW